MDIAIFAVVILYSTNPFIFCHGRFILAKSFYTGHGHVLFAVVTLYSTNPFIFAMVVLYSPNLFILAILPVIFTISQLNRSHLDHSLCREIT